MSEPSPVERFPRGALLGATVLLGLTLLLAATARQTGVGVTTNPTSTVVEQHALRFEDRPDGAVEVRTVADGEVIERLAPGTNGFVRSVLRGLVRERTRRGIGAEPPFELTRWADGRLSLDDPATGRTVELGVFGPSNADAFARLLLAARVEPLAARVEP